TATGASWPAATATCRTTTAWTPTGGDGRAVTDANPTAGRPWRVAAWVAALADAVVSRRGLAVLFLAGAAALATAGWLRPPLSPGIRGVHLPLGVGNEGKPTPESILAGPRRVVPTSAGVILLALIGAGLVVVLRRPDRLGVVAGVLLCASVAGNAAAALNHPALIELLEHE